MTQLRKVCCPQCGYNLEPISNYFDALLDGIGHRGSSFTDIDGTAHDEATDRWLFMEFKGPGEALSKGQRRHLSKLARKNYLTVWCLRKRGDGTIDWCDVATRRAEVITPEELKERYRRWWNNEPFLPPNTGSVVVPIDNGPLEGGKDAASISADDIRW